MILAAPWWIVIGEYRVEKSADIEWDENELAQPPRFRGVMICASSARVQPFQWTSRHAAPIGDACDGALMPDSTAITGSSLDSSSLNAQRARGRLKLSFVLRDGKSRLSVLSQRAPSRALFPVVEHDEPPQVAIVNTGGGLAGGDEIVIGVAVETGAAATVTTPAAEKIYRSLGPDTLVRTRLAAGSGAVLEWLPQETILFDGSRLHRRLELELDPSARFLGGEIVLFGRQARGESFDRGSLYDSWTVRIGGRCAWVEAVGLSDDILTARTRSFGFGTAAGYATLIVAGPGASSLLPFARETAAAAPSEGGSTVVNGVLLMRFLDAGAARLRASAMMALATLRPLAAGGPRRLPRLWSN
jgi:urease accessory protein